MNCNECRRHWELYHDSEGDSELYLEINEHLAQCQSCAKWFFQQQQFEMLLTTKLSAAEPTPELWDRVLSETGIVRLAAARSWMFLGSSLVLAASLLLAFTIWNSRPNEGTHLSALTAVVHREFAEGGKQIEFTSASDREVEQYLKGRVPFAVRCPPREDAGFEVRGGGICAIGNKPAAYVMGRVEGEEVSIFILPEERLLTRFTHERELLGREPIHHCREGDFEMVLTKIDHNVVVVTGKVAPQQLERVVRAYGTYPEAPVDKAA